MSVNIIRLERLALLVVLGTFGIIFKLVMLIPMVCSAAKKLAAMCLRHLDARRGLSRPHSPPAA